MRRVVWALGVCVVSACGNEKLLDDGGLPSKLSKVKCGSSTEELIRAYPELTIEKKDSKAATYCRVTPGVEKVCASVLDGTIALAVVYFMRDSPSYDFGKTLSQLETELGKGDFDQVKKKVEWTPKANGKKSITLMSTQDFTALATNCP
jgi:hypothetical protein